MALIAMATYCTEENCSGSYPRNKILYDVLVKLQFELDSNPNHRLFIIDNSPGDKAKKVLERFKFPFWTLIDNQGVNLGTAEAINKAWRNRASGEHCIKMDDDCLIQNPERVFDLMEECIRRKPEIGIVGLKRKDCIEKPERTDFYHSELEMLKQNTGEQWIIIEKVRHVMGTCQMYNSALLDKIGYLKQPDIYGFDDVWAAIRSEQSGFINCFIPHVIIDHIDPGDTIYQKKKEAHAGKYMPMHHELKRKWETGELDLYYEPDWIKLESQKSREL